MKKKRKIILNYNVILYIFVIAIIVLLCYFKIRYHNIITHGIPVQCEIIEATTEWEEIRGVTRGTENGTYNDVAYLKYNIDGKEYRCKVRSNLGNYGDKVELIYLPSEPEHVFSLKGAIAFSEVVNYVLIGWILFWVFGKLFIDWIFNRFYEP